MCIICFQENYLGEDQKFRDLSDTSTSTSARVDSGSEDVMPERKSFDPRKYRALEVKVLVTLHDIQAHLVKVSLTLSICEHSGTPFF